MKCSHAASLNRPDSIYRAMEILRPPAERIYNDPYARLFLGRSRADLVGPIRLKLINWLSDKMFPGVNGAVIARGRFIDEVVTTSLHQGLDQLVILGAGYDSRAYRLPGLQDRVKVFEVDHPATLEDKQEKLRLIFQRPPEHVVYVAIDLTKDPLGEALFESGYDPRKRTLFILEGVLMYLSRARVRTILDFIPANSGAGSAVVLDIVPASIVDGTIEAREGRAIYRFARRSGEPIAFGLDEDDLEDFLVERNFCRIRQFNAFECHPNFLDPSQKYPKVSAIFTFAHAVVRQRMKPHKNGRHRLRIIRNGCYGQQSQTRLPRNGGRAARETTV